jgi:uncharacterized protein YndB with AHSA1/START domain
MPSKTSTRKRKGPSKATRPKSRSFNFKQKVNASPLEVFRAFTHATLLRDWFCNAAQVDPRQGGLYWLGWDSGFYASGEIRAFDPGKKLVLTWDGKGEPEPTRVSVSFTPKGEGTVVTVSHAGVGAGAKWAPVVKEIETGWTDGLENLKSVLEAGIDLRLARRPRLGIFFGEFTPEIAAKLGVPTRRGIWLEGTAEGSGARAAGLQKDDVLVKFGGKTAVDIAGLGQALQGRKAGDVVTVGFYRGAQKMSTALELSRFPIPDVPETPGELADQVEKNYVDLNVELEKLLEGLTEDQAGHADGELWSARELLAHHTLMERDFQSWVADMLNDTPVKDFLEMRPNVNERLRVLTARFNTLAALLGEMKQAQAETVALLRSLPPKFVARRHLYRRVALWMLENIPTHYREEHAEQLKTAIEAARKK